MTPRANGTAPDDRPNLGDLIVVMLAGTLVGLRDRLADDGYGRAADLVGDLVDLVDDYLARVAT